MMPGDQADKVKVKWYLKRSAVIIAILIVGPLAIPLVWISPAFKKWHKAAITILVALATIWLVNASMAVYHMLLDQMQSLQSILK